jgi:lipopolysaccharide assembly outer membrane protein LptD (OstA)
MGKLKVLLITGLILLGLTNGILAGELHLRVEGVDETTPWGFFDLQKKTYVIKPQGGRVLIDYDDTYIEGSQVEYNEEEGSALIQGDVLLRQKELNVTCSQLKAYFRQGRYIFQDNVDLTKDDYQLTAQQVEYWEEEDKLEAKNQVVIHFQDGHVTGDHFTILLEEEQLSGYGPGTAQIQVE